jgi:hypothetical protein
MSIQTVQNQDPQTLELEYPQQPLALPPIPSQTSLSSGIYNPSSIDEGSVKSSKGSVMYDSFASPPFRTQSVPTTVKVGSTRGATQRTSSIPSTMNLNYPPTQVLGGNIEVVQPASSEETVEGPPPQQAQAGPSNPTRGATQQTEAGPSNPTEKRRKDANDYEDALKELKELNEIRETQKTKKGWKNNRANLLAANLRILYKEETGEEIENLTLEERHKLELKLRAKIHQLRGRY